MNFVGISYHSLYKQAGEQPTKLKHCFFGVRNQDLQRNTQMRQPQSILEIDITKENKTEVAEVSGIIKFD